MRNVQLLGVSLLVLGILIMVGYGLYHFAIAEDAPLIIKTGVIVIFLGIIVVLLSLIRERLRDLKKEREYKAK
jgi:multisubunit Na+/H+ antiporter MnhB subunit